MAGEFLFLGTGASSGVPLIGCQCPVCLSSDPKDKRLRPSGLLKCRGKSILIDIGPDFRAQALTHRIDHLDGLILTHTHYDHIAGIDELRPLNYRLKKAFPCLLSDESHRDLQRRYYYLFGEAKEQEYLSAKLDCHLFSELEGETSFLSLPIRFFTYRQASMRVNGYRIGSFAYVSDIREFDESIFRALEGVKTLVLSALRADASRVHFNFEEAVRFADRVGAPMTWLTHLSHSHCHEEICRLLPPSVQPAYDGLSLALDEVSHA